MVLGEATADADGNIHIKESFGFMGLPTGARIWLVLTSDLLINSDPTQNSMTGWNPVEYLFEYNLIDPATLLTRK